MPYLLILLAMFLVTSCDDARDLTLPEGQLPDSPIPVVWHPENADYLELRWTKVPRSIGYHVYSSNVSNGSYQRVASVHDTIWEHPLAAAFPDAEYAVYYFVTSLVDSQESLPSGEIGCYFKGIYVSLSDTLVYPVIQFSLYLVDWEKDQNGVPIPRTTSLMPQDVIGSALQRGGEWNMIFESGDTSRLVYRDANGDWHGILAELGLSFTKTYKWNVTTSTDWRAYFTGRVKNGDVGPVWIEGSSEFGSTSTGYAWRDARHLAVTELGLLESGFQGSTNPTSSDQLVASKGGATARYNPVTGEWEGSLVRLKPGDVYYIQLRHSGGFEYTYVAAE